MRDKRSPVPKNENVSRVMSANKAKDTKPEIILRKALWKAGLRGYRVNYKKLPGRPDIAFVSKKVAIFVHGCFWHRCPYCNYPLPKNNTRFWKEKFKKNVERDERKIKELQKLGWQVIVIWECELKGKINLKEIIVN
ncbi:MAG TPA: very short patch repair endonuclease [Chitinophagaceae bacterium]|jgi:DNA mismatch endonuclease (patch repair protein)|nr:very short patch repair endonuclease [Chitinophagaceae bacterium]